MFDVQDINTVGVLRWGINPQNNYPKGELL